MCEIGFLKNIFCYFLYPFGKNDVTLLKFFNKKRIMASLNKVMLIGRLGKDPEILTFENGNKKMSVSLATSERYRDRNGEWAEQTDWHNLVAFGNLALDIAEKRRNYVKGDMMYVEGRLKTRQYVDAQNVTRYVTEILVDKMMSIGANRIQGNPEHQNTSYNSYQQTTGSYQQPMVGAQQPSVGYQQPAFNAQQPQLPQMPDPGYDGDDLPF